MAEPIHITVSEHPLSNSPSRNPPRGYKRRRDMPPEELARRFDLVLGRVLGRSLRAGEPPDGDVLSTIERRLKALGETKKPEPKEKPAPAGDPTMATFAEELAKETKDNAPTGEQTEAG